MGNILSRQSEPETADQQLTKLHKAYEKYLLPLEEMTAFTKLCDPPYSEADVKAKPMLLLMGQYSTGKTTFIRALLHGQEYPGSHIGAEPTTDCFMAVMRGHNDDIVPGNTLVNNTTLPFHSLKYKYGESFLQKFRGSFMSQDSPSDILDDLIIIDTPGTLDGSKERGYNFPEVMGWFAKRAAMIIIFFDVNKMGVSTEMKQVLDNIQGNEEKVRVVFNKADQVDERDLTGSYGGLRHNLANSMPTPEVPEVYVTSLDTLNNDNYRTKNERFIEWFSKDKDKLMNDIDRMKKNTYARKVNLIDKRARLVRNHAYVMIKLWQEKKKCKSIFKSSKQKKKDWDKIIDTIPEFYRVIQSEKQASKEFVSARMLQEKLRNEADINKLPKLNEKKIDSSFKKVEKSLNKLANMAI